MWESRENNKTVVNGGVGVTGLLQIAFIVLKLCHVIEWSWWWVLSPIWISTLISVIFFIFLLWLWLTK